MGNNKKIHWRGAVPDKAIDALLQPGGLIVCPTKVGYIIMTADNRGLERKFDSKNRKRNKPGVVLCSSLEQVRELAELNEEVEAFYQTHWNQDILLGCILPWKQSGKQHIPDDGARKLMMDERNTSCFVIKFGEPSEIVVRSLWENHRKLIFASSANPSGQGNRGLVECIGDRITSEADVIVAANAYVASMQPGKDDKTRYEQGVMVSMVDDKGLLVPIQNQKFGISPAPTVIRKGLSVDHILSELSNIFTSWDYRHGQYY